MADATNLPGPMYAYYLRKIYLDNSLREPDALTMLGESGDLRLLTMPAYVFAAREDHIVPWRSGLSAVRPRRRRVDVRAWRVRPHRRRHQSTGSEASQLLG